MIEISKNEEKMEHPQTVHIVLGLSPAGSLKAALHKCSIRQEQKKLLYCPIFNRLGQ